VEGAVRHHLFTRQKYDDDTFRRRMDLALRTCIPAVLESASELAPGFRWTWKAHARHESEIRRILEAEGWAHEIAVVETFTPPEPGSADLHSTLDSDDIIGPDYLRMQQSYWRPGITEVRSWQPVKQRLSDGTLYHHRLQYRARRRVSPFYMISNPTPTIYAYSVTHMDMQSYAPTTWERETGAICVVHGANALNSIDHRDLRIAS
jgi:hypothetical protein